MNPTDHTDTMNLVQRTLRDSAYALTAGALGIASFVVAVTGVSVGVGLLITLLGLPVLAATVYAARGFAHVERLRLRALLGRPAPLPAYARAGHGASWLRRAVQPLRDPQSWLDVLWSLVSFVTGLAAFVVTLTWWAVAGAGLTYWFWQRFIPFDEDDETLAELTGLGDGRMAEIWLQTAIGALALLTLPLAVRLVAATHAGLAQLLLCSRAELQQEVRRVRVGRDAAREAEAHSLRRLERDIHDGPQQRLVRLAMDLGRARRQLDADPELARATIDGALAQTRETVEELRSLSRGIAPAILVDRGLPAALDELFGRSAVPVESTVELPADLPPHVETAIYFVVSEALTNAAKHGFASLCSVRAAQRDGAIVVSVADDGVGGAHAGKGSGLAGLTQRVAAADGTLEVVSPEGGPTEVRAVIPCA